MPRIINKDIKECPYCRNDEYIIKQSYSGTCDYGMRFDDQEADNGEMWDNASLKIQVNMLGVENVVDDFLN